MNIHVSFNIIILLLLILNIIIFIAMPNMILYGKTLEVGLYLSFCLRFVCL